MSEIDPHSAGELERSWRERALPTGTATLLLADVEGSTRLWETQPEEMTAAFARARVGYGILPVVWRLDPSCDARMLFDEVQEMGAVEQLDRFALSEVKGCFAVSACRDEYALRCAVVLECAEAGADGQTQQTS